MGNEDFYNKLRNECRISAFHSFGYQYTFRNRIGKFESYISLLKFFGVLTPALIGVLVLAYGKNWDALNLFIAIATFISTIHFTISLFAIFAKWEEKLSYSYEAAVAYNGLHQRYQKIADYPPVDIETLKAETELLNSEANGRDQQDFKQKVSEKEDRKAMRWSLRNYQKACAGCSQIPTGMKSTKCDVCGNF